MNEETQYKTKKQLISLLQTILESRDFDVDDIDDEIFEYEIDRAISEINKCRRFVATQDKPYDLKYEYLIIPLTISAFAKIGAEGQSRHSENGVTRSYTSGGDYPKDMLNEIIPLVR